MGFINITSILVIIHILVVLSIWVLASSREFFPTFADGTPFEYLHKCRTGESTLSQSTWRELDIPIDLQSPAFVADAYERTGRNFSIHCYDANISAVSQEQRSIYSPVTKGFMLPQDRGNCHPFHVFTMEDACQCLSRFRVILGFGDSLTRRIMESWMTSSPTVNQYSKETRVPHNVTILEESSLLPCGNVASLTKVYKLTAWLFPHLRTKVIPTLNELHSSGLSVNVLLIGFGLHTIMDTQHSDLEYWISETVSTLKEHPATKHAHVFWMLPHQLVPSKFPAPRNVTDKDRNIQVQKFNNLVADIVRQEHWIVLNFYNLTEGKGQQTPDGVHFWPDIYRWKNQHVLNRLCPHGPKI